MPNTIFEKQGTTLTVRPESQLDSITAPVLEGQLRPYMDDVREVSMDFTKVEYISSGGIRVLLATEQQLERRGGGLTLIHVNDTIQEILKMLGFLDLVTVVQD